VPNAAAEAGAPTFGSSGGYCKGHDADEKGEGWVPSFRASCEKKG